MFTGWLCLGPDTGYTGKTALFSELAGINNWIIIYVNIVTDLGELGKRVFGKNGGSVEFFYFIVEFRGRRGEEKNKAAEGDSATLFWRIDLGVKLFLNLYNILYWTLVLNQSSIGISF